MLRKWWVCTVAALMLLMGGLSIHWLRELSRSSPGDVEARELSDASDRWSSPRSPQDDRSQSRVAIEDEEPVRPIDQALVNLKSVVALDNESYGPPTIVNILIRKIVLFDDRLSDPCMQIEARVTERHDESQVRILQLITMMYSPYGIQRDLKYESTAPLPKEGQLRSALIRKFPSRTGRFQLIALGDLVHAKAPIEFETSWPEALEFIGQGLCSVLEVENLEVDPRLEKIGFSTLKMDVKGVLWSSHDVKAGAPLRVLIMGTGFRVPETYGVHCVVVAHTDVPLVPPALHALWEHSDTRVSKRWALH